MIFLNVHRNWTLSTKFLTVSLSRPITSGTLTIYWRRCGNTWDSSECESIMLVISKSCSSRVLLLAEFDNKTLYLLLPCASRAFSVFLMSHFMILLNYPFVEFSATWQKSYFLIKLNQKICNVTVSFIIIMYNISLMHNVTISQYN